MARKLFFGIRTLVTNRLVKSQLGVRPNWESLGVVSEGCLLVEKGRVLWSGSFKDFKKQKSLYSTVTHSIDLNAQLVLPGFVECHTHPLFAGSRSAEFEAKILGKSYLEISQSGGGIQSTVKETRKATPKALKELFIQRVHNFIEQGVVALEVKSGYGLDFATELKLLKIASDELPVKVVKTYLGLHSIPAGLSGEDYLKRVIDIDLPKLAKKGLLDRVDVFVEKGFYTVDQAKKLFSVASELGLKLTAHIDQLSASQGIKELLSFAPQSLDHLVYTTKEEGELLAKSSTVAVLLPLADFYLQISYPEARRLIDQGVKVALSTDFNPGTSPTQSLNFLGVLARLKLKMSLPEVLTAMTFNAALSLGIEDHYGHLDVGASASFVSFDCALEDLFYRVGDHPVSRVFVNGKARV